MFERSEFAACPRWASTAGSRSAIAGRRQWGQPFFGLRLDGCAKKGDCPAGGTARPAATVAPNAAQATTNLYPKYLRKNGFSAYSTCASSYEKQSISHLRRLKKECLRQGSRKASPGYSDRLLGCRVCRDFYAWLEISATCGRPVCKPLSGDSDGRYRPQRPFYPAGFAVYITLNGLTHARTNSHVLRQAG